MRSAHSLYRLSLGLAALGGVALLGGLVAAVRAVDLQAPRLRELAEACWRVLPSEATPSSIAVAALVGMSLAAAALAVRSLIRQRRQQRRFFATLREVESMTVGDATVILVEDERPQAFCAGFQRPRIFLSTAALIALDDAELRAVVEHERHHQRRRDPLRLLIAHVLADALFFVPALRRLRDRYVALAEIAADDAVVRHVGDRASLASALLAFGDRAHADVVVGIAPERVDHLLGAPARWSVPLPALLAGLGAIAGLATLAVATAQATTPGQIGLPLLAAEICMLAMTAAPAFLGAGLLLAGARRAAPR